MKEQEEKSVINTTSKKLGSEDNLKETVDNNNTILVSFNKFVDLGSARVHQLLDEGKNIVIQTQGKEPIVVKKIKYSF